MQGRLSPAQSVMRAFFKTVMWAFGGLFFLGVLLGDKCGMYDSLSKTEVVSVHKPEKATFIRSFAYSGFVSLVCGLFIYGCIMLHAQISLAI